ncbi:MAG: hypothetical protein VYA17_02700, partial [Pseudomonadota bacterium]|nr:hypothetical protein [Pseudomonadota bacterium]
RYSLVVKRDDDSRIDFPPGYYYMIDRYTGALKSGNKNHGPRLSVGRRVCKRTATGDRKF